MWEMPAVIILKHWVDNVLNILLPTTKPCPMCCQFHLSNIWCLCVITHKIEIEKVLLLFLLFKSLFQALTVNILVYGNCLFLESSDSSLSPFQFILQGFQKCVSFWKLWLGKFYFSSKFNPITKRVFVSKMDFVF